MKQRIKAAEQNIHLLMDEIKQLKERICKLETKPKLGRPRNEDGRPGNPSDSRA